MRLKKRFKKLIRNLAKRWDLVILFIFIATYSTTFSWLSILRHNAFASNYDLANMSQTVWNTLNGRPFALSGAEGTVSRFSIHADLILALISPLYLIWERAITLLITQSLALGLGAIPVFFLSREIIKKQLDPFSVKIIALSLVIVYLLNPTMQWTNIYDFHGVALAIPFLLATFYFAFTKKWVWFWLFALLSLTTKEEISLLIATIGIAIFFVFKEKIIGATTFFIGIIWFIFMVYVIIPNASPSGQNWTINSLYTPAIQKIHNSDNMLELFDVFRGYFLTTDAFGYYIALLKPFAFIPIIGLPWLLLAAPEFAVNLLSTNAQMQGLTFHYDSGITPFLIIANIFGLKYLFSFFSQFKLLLKYKKLIPSVVAIAIIAVSVRINYHYSPLPTTPSCWCLSYRVSQDDLEFAKILTTIPKDAPITSSGEIRPHVARREHSYVLPGHIDTAEYVAILDENRIIGDYSPKELENALLKDQKFLDSHQLVNHIGHFYLFKKKDK